MLHIDLLAGWLVCAFQKQDVQLCLKVTEGQRKCHVNCVGRIALVENRKMEYVGVRKIYNYRSFQPQQSFGIGSQSVERVVSCQQNHVVWAQSRGRWPPN